MSPGTDIVPASQYAALKYEGGTGELLETIRANIGAAQLSEWDLDRVKVPAAGGKTWEVQSLDGDISTRELTGVIVNWKDTRSFWKASFESSGGGTPPDCSSNDAIHANIMGDPGVAVPTDGEGYICGKCPNAQFGSAVRDDGKESNGQACRQSRVLFLLTENDLLPFVVALPPTSIKPAAQYFLRLARGGVPYYSVITTLTLDKATSGGNIDYSVTNFKVAARLQGGDLARIREYATALKPLFERTVADYAEGSADRQGDDTAEDVGTADFSGATETA